MDHIKSISKELVDALKKILDSRVKTLHPSVHGGILARRDLDSHMEALQKFNISAIDVVIMNLYPFYETIMASRDVSFDNCIVDIDIGGPTMIRAASKNHKDVLVGKGNLDDTMFQRRLAWKAFHHKQTNSSEFVPSFNVVLERSSSLRYGEITHQKVAFYFDKSLCGVKLGGIASALQHHGKEMSYNNYLDEDAAWNSASEFFAPTCVVMTHTNPCGIASHHNLVDAYKLALEADPVTAFGGIVAFNVQIDEVLVKTLCDIRSSTDKAFQFLSFSSPSSSSSSPSPPTSYSPFFPFFRVHSPHFLLMVVRKSLREGAELKR
ncbi:hypothetical protein KP509_13G026700 [Ceratopteris richardii]|uniref:MGS-like domain-containing protein n=1 Tax=Ceratopteris richardii TaxID=49495 RepID=A0A8T2TJR1_CERRI|nr:hypothetical protein KP509_13G026700 [Ceratopteris richardii]